MQASNQEDLEMCSKLIEHLQCVLAQVHNIWIYTYCGMYAYV